jgi:adenylate cyclase
LAPAATYVLTAGLVLLGVLGWRLTGEERERARLRRLFGRYVSGQVVDALLDSGQRPELGGQSQTVTVLFSDIRNFTTISERLEAKEVVEMLNTYFERACAVLMAEGGSIDKFIGDAVMVEFGSPLPVADHAIRGVRAALALHAVAQEFAGWMAARFPGRDLPPFAVGIGLHSGEAVIGNIGSPTRMEFTAIGDTVNLASRLEGMTKQLGCAILASEQTIAAAGPAVRCGCSEVISVKGREAPVRVHEVLKVEEGESSDA